MNDDLISRQAAIDGKILITRSNGLEIYSDEAVPVAYLQSLPSAESEQICIAKVTLTDKQIKEAFEKVKCGILTVLPYAQQWIPGNERIPEGLIIVQFNDGDFDLLQFPTAYRRKDIVAWMPLPKPWKGEEK